MPELRPGEPRRNPPGAPRPLPEVSLGSTMPSDRKAAVDPIRHLRRVPPRAGAASQSRRRSTSASSPDFPTGEYQVDGARCALSTPSGRSLCTTRAGFFEPNDRGAYSVNSVVRRPRTPTAPSPCNFGGCADDRPNCLPIADGWNYAVRLYLSAGRDPGRLVHVPVAAADRIAVSRPRRGPRGSVPVPVDLGPAHPLHPAERAERRGGPRRWPQRRVVGDHVRAACLRRARARCATRGARRTPGRRRRPSAPRGRAGPAGRRGRGPGRGPAEGPAGTGSARGALRGRGSRAAAPTTSPGACGRA